MTRDEAVSLIRDNLGNHTSFSEDKILLRMNAVQHKYETGDDGMPLAWITFNPDGQVILYEGNDTAELPEGYIDMDEDTLPYIFLQGGARARLERGYLAGGRLQYGTPTHYAIAGTSIYFDKIADRTYSMNFPAYRRLPKLSTVEESAWLEHFGNLIVLETTVQQAKANRDEGAVRFFHDDLMLARADYIRAVEARKHTGRVYTIGPQ